MDRPLPLQRQLQKVPDILCVLSAATSALAPPACSTFTEEAERQCPHDILSEGLSLSAQGLLYHFDQKPADYGYSYKKKEEAEEPEEAELDVILSLINGVNSGKKKSSWDNGVVQVSSDMLVPPDEKAERLGLVV